MEKEINVQFSLEGYYEDVVTGQKICSRGRTITETDLVNFAALTWDTYPLHTNAEWAKNTLYGERIAHGMLVLSYAMGLYMGCAGNLKIAAFYGLDKLRFTGPTRIGDTIFVEGEILEKEGRDSKGGVLTSRFTVKNQLGETLIEAITKILVSKHPGESERKSAAPLITEDN